MEIGGRIGGRIGRKGCMDVPILHDDNIMKLSI